MHKEHVVQMHIGVLLSHKKEWNLAIYSSMDGRGGCYTKWNKSEKDIIGYHLYVESKKYSKLANVTKTDTQRE